MPLNANPKQDHGGVRVCSAFVLFVRNILRERGERKIIRAEGILTSSAAAAPTTA
jgi:hypothetical protein